MTNEEAAKLIDNFLDGDEFDALRHDEIKAMELAILVLKDERPQGEWKEFKYGLYYCSRCFERVDKDIERIDALVSKGERSNYCPACGAKMGGTT